MTTPNQSPADQARQKMDSLRFTIDNLRDKASLKSVIDNFATLQSTIANLPLRIQGLRQRKYAFNKMMEKKAEDITARFLPQQDEIERRITTQASMLQATMRSIEMRFNALGALPSLTTVQLLTNETEQFEDRCRSTGNAVEAIFDPIQREADALSRELREVETALDKADSASFGFLPGESLVCAVKTVWCRSGKEQKDDPEGNLFLTDQRLIFEQNEEIATKKVLFVTTEKQKVQSLLFEVPVVSIEDIKSYKLGLLKNQDMLELRLASGCFSPQAVLHLDGQDCAEWQKKIGLVKTHEIDADRALAVDKTAVEKARSAPTQCPKCGGLITKPVLRGMDTITCEFCGNVIRL
jgi:hypothetical protein